MIFGVDGALTSPVYYCTVTVVPGSPSLSIPLLSGARMAKKPKSVDPDADLVKRAQGGETRAFDELIMKYSRKLIRSRLQYDLQ